MYLTIEKIKEKMLKEFYSLWKTPYGNGKVKLKFDE
jgi:hypothetical protein